MLVIATFGLALAIITEATLSFLGVGVPPTTPSHGTLIPNGNPWPPQTRLLLEAIPDLKMGGHERVPLSGKVPSPLDPATGCAFHPRCPWAFDRCRRERPEVLTSGVAPAACHAVAEGRAAA